jgi:osmotically-inducible protein OsmY
MKNDEQLQADVEQELRWEPSVHAERIGVSVTGGVVELDGHVESLFEKWGAERAAMRVFNAKAVASEIKATCRLRQAGPMKTSHVPPCTIWNGITQFRIQ